MGWSAEATERIGLPPIFLCVDQKLFAEVLSGALVLQALRAVGGSLGARRQRGGGGGGGSRTISKNTMENLLTPQGLICGMRSMLDSIIRRTTRLRLRE